ncbi:MAG: Lrp/AsnC family transcriptional regulator [Pikeienuella sp.]|uniref:Lrp/AsnC family transcriptional regulator n=1 Tax=Pikeienuella sp. TaxID=2831957 RepID=UPI003919EBF3
MKLDRIDRAILRELQSDGRLSVAELAARVNLSKTPAHARLRRLIAEGYILGFSAQVDHARLGLGHVAFVQVTLSDTRAPALEAFNAAVRALPAVEQCHMIAGAFDYLLKVRSADIAEYRRMLGEEIARLPHVANTSTFVSMEAVKEAGAPPPA